MTKTHTCTLDSTPVTFSSNEGCPNKIYLDFDGEFVTPNAWTTVPLSCTGFSLDGDFTTFNQQEQDTFLDLANRAAQFYAPFNLDVTTVRPSAAEFATNRIAHVIFTQANNSFPLPTAGGIGFLDAFGKHDYYSSGKHIIWVYYYNTPNTKTVGKTIAHEFGHNLGLSHDGNFAGVGFDGVNLTEQGYYDHHYNGSTAWGPIMGTCFDGAVCQWSKGEYPFANNQEDDMLIISSKLGYKSKGPLVLNQTTDPNCNLSFAGKSFIRHSLDVDIWEITGINPPPGYRATITINARPFSTSYFYPPINTTKKTIARGAPLDIEVFLGSGVRDTIGQLDITVTDDLFTGPNAFFQIRGASERVGLALASKVVYSAYGSVGTYDVSVCVNYEVPTIDLSCNTTAFCCDQNTKQFASNGLPCPNTPAGSCDKQQYCIGSGLRCSPPLRYPATYVCALAETPCEETVYCSGVSAICPSKPFKANATRCRSQNGPCDRSEFCTGTSSLCPPDGFYSANTRCDAGMQGPCDKIDFCSGTSGACVDTRQPSGKICRNSTTPCDAPETCDGVSVTCPPSTGALQPAGAICRNPTAGCDMPEFCDGITDTCPPDNTSLVAIAGTICRPAAGPCDVAEVCNGVLNTCPADAFVPGGFTTNCRQKDAANVCDYGGWCTGSASYCANYGFGSTKICRQATGPCGSNTGCASGATCPPEKFLASGTACNFSGVAGTCSGNSSSCAGSSPVVPPSTALPANVGTGDGLASSIVTDTALTSQINSVLSTSSTANFTTTLSKSYSISGAVATSNVVQYTLNPIPSTSDLAGIKERIIAGL